MRILIAIGITIGIILGIIIVPYLIGKLLKEEDEYAWISGIEIMIALSVFVLLTLGIYNTL